MTGYTNQQTLIGWELTGQINLIADVLELILTQEESASRTGILIPAQHFQKRGLSGRNIDRNVALYQRI
jgi:hypothetical protein